MLVKMMRCYFLGMLLFSSLAGEDGFAVESC